MLKVALTGGIATGKTQVLRRLASLGVSTIDADWLARQAVRPGTSGWEAVRARFGDTVLVTPGGEIDRKKLGAIVFADDAARRDLEAIIHPRVTHAITDWLAGLEREGAHAIAVADIPLLFEIGHQGDFDKVIVTMCAPELQVCRLVDRDSLSDEEARRRLAAQWSIEEKARHADYVIDTNGTVDETNRQVEFVYRELQRAADSGRRAGG